MTHTNTHRETIDNEATRKWLAALEEARSVFERSGLGRFCGAPDTRLYDIPEIADAASRLVSKRSKRKEGEAVSWQLHTGADYKTSGEVVYVEWTAS